MDPYKTKVKAALSCIELQIPSVITQNGEGFYAYLPAFKGLHVDGSTQQEAKERVRPPLLCILNP